MASDIELEKLYDEHAQVLFAFLLALTRDEDDTHDLLQEVFIKLAKHPGMLDSISDRRAFLIRLAHNAAIDMLRRRGTRQKHQGRLMLASASIFAQPGNPDESTFQAALGQALAELPPDQRAVVHLKLWEGFTFEQVAIALEIPPNTAASRYRYGLDKLRERLRPLYDEIK